MNEKIIKEFYELYKHLRQLPNIPSKPYKLQHAKYVISFLKKIPYEINNNNVSNLINYDRIGEKTVSKIREILNTGSIHSIPADNSIISNLTAVPYIGYSTAISLMKKGVTSINDLKYKITNDNFKVSNQIYINLMYDIKKNINRADIDKLKNIIMKNISVKFTICGSYRRGLSTSNDIDILILSNLKDFVDALSKIYNIKHITTKFKQKYSGIIYLNSTWRHLDILSVKKEQYATALMYFTGSATFNQLIRRHAKSLNCKLSEHALVCNGKQVEVKTEYDIFKHLDLKYLKPEQRIF